MKIGGDVMKVIQLSSMKKHPTARLIFERQNMEFSDPHRFNDFLANEISLEEISPNPQGVVENK